MRQRIKFTKKGNSVSWARISHAPSKTRKVLVRGKQVFIVISPAGRALHSPQKGLRRVERSFAGGVELIIVYPAGPLTDLLQAGESTLHEKISQSNEADPKIVQSVRFRIFSGARADVI